MIFCLCVFCVWCTLEADPLSNHIDAIIILKWKQFPMINYILRQLRLVDTMATLLLVLYETLVVWNICTRRKKSDYFRPKEIPFSNKIINPIAAIIHFIKLYLTRKRQNDPKHNDKCLFIRKNDETQCVWGSLIVYCINKHTTISTWHIRMKTSCINTLHQYSSCVAVSNAIIRIDYHR